MDDPVKPIAVVRGASSTAVEEMFRALADLWRPDIRLAGVFAEGHGLANRLCNAGFLRNAATGERFSIFHDLALARPRATLTEPERSQRLRRCSAILRQGAISFC